MVNIGTRFKCRNSEEIEYLIINLSNDKVISSPYDGVNAFTPLNLTPEEFNVGIESGLYYLITKQ